MLSFHLLVTLWAVNVGKVYARPVPSQLQFVHEAFFVEYVFALELDTRLLTQVVRETNGAEGVSIPRQSGLFIGFDTVRVQTRQTLGFVQEATALMAAFEYLVATFAHGFLTVDIFTDILEGRFIHLFNNLQQFELTESTLNLTVPVSELLTSVAQVVRFNLAS